MTQATSRVLVTGCSSGFGALTALALARAGHRVTAGIRDVAGRNAQAAADLRERAGGALRVIELDVTDDASTAAAVASVTAADGGIDVLINNAGVAATGLLETFTIEQAQRVFDVNVFGPLRMCRAVLPGMKERGGGLIVHITSEIGRLVLPGVGLYCATKFALEAIAETLHHELVAAGVESVMIEPATYPTTAMMRNRIDGAEPERAAGYGPVAELPAQLGGALAAMVEQGRAPDPSDIAEAIVRIVAAPRGARPLRTLLDSPLSRTIAELNGVAEAAQRTLLIGYGMASLLRTTE